MNAVAVAWDVVTVWALSVSFGLLLWWFWVDLFRRRRKRLADRRLRTQLLAEAIDEVERFDVTSPRFLDPIRPVKPKRSAPRTGALRASIKVTGVAGRGIEQGWGRGAAFLAPESKFERLDEE